MNTVIRQVTCKGLSSLPRGLTCIVAHIPSFLPEGSTFPVDQSYLLVKFMLALLITIIKTVLNFKYKFPFLR